MTATTAGARTTLTIARDPLPDSSLALAFDPYRFISRRRQAFGTDLFACHLMLRKTVCIGGPDAARLFYDTASFRRSGVVPGAVRKTLLGEGGIHGLDGADHRHRKAMFLSFMGLDCVPQFSALLKTRLSARLPRWKGQEVNILDEARRTLFCAIMDGLVFHTPMKRWNIVRAI